MTTNFANHVKYFHYLCIKKLGKEMLINPKVSKYCAHIKMSSYIGAFLQYVYGAAATNGIIYLPEDFKYANPRLTLLHDVMFHTLTNGVVNPDWNTDIMQSNASYCDFAVLNKGSEMLTKNYKNYIPQLTDTNLYRFALPDVYIDRRNKCHWNYTTAFSQLAPEATAKFRKVAKLFFWESLSWHIDNIYDPLEMNTKRACFEDFILRYDIPYEDLETIYRCYSRERAACKRIVNQLFDKIDPVRPIFFLKKS